MAPPHRLEPDQAEHAGAVARRALGRCTMRDLAELVRSMRAAQKKYFATRNPSVLEESKSWERRVDAAVREVLDAQGRLDFEADA